LLTPNQNYKIMINSYKASQSWSLINNQFIVKWWN
jgi:hypothetical protein